MEDVLPQIYQEIDDASDIANMFYVSRGWRTQYAYCAMMLCKRRFDAWKKIVNDPFTCDRGPTEGGPIRPSYFVYRRPSDLIDSEGVDDDNHEELINWYYPYSPEFPQGFFEQIIDDVPLFGSTFRRYNLDGFTDHMCITPISEEEHNAFESPQEWFPFYYKDGVIIGVNVGNNTPSVIGIVIYLEEQTTNRITDIGTAFTIIQDWELVCDEGVDGFVFADKYLQMLDLDDMELSE